MHIYNLNLNDRCEEANISEVLGDRGCFLNQMATLGLPISPAFVFDADAFKSLNENSTVHKHPKETQYHIEKVKIYRLLSQTSC